MRGFTHLLIGAAVRAGGCHHPWLGTPRTYLDGVLADGDLDPLCRLQYGGSATFWGFAVYLASKDGYQDSVLPSGAFEGTPEEALDCACGLYVQA